jgi:hypothetical protein
MTDRVAWVVILPDLKIQGVPKKMSPVIFGGITSLYLIKGSIFLQWVEKQSYYINRSIYLTKILNRPASRDT